MNPKFDSIIIGARQAGIPHAGRLSQAGQRLALLERNLFGGTCVDTGCVPIKALVARAFAAHMARRASEFGITVNGVITADIFAAKARMTQSRQGLVGVENRLRKHEELHGL